MTATPGRAGSAPPASWSGAAGRGAQGSGERPGPAGGPGPAAPDMAAPLGCRSGAGPGRRWRHRPRAPAGGAPAPPPPRGGPATAGMRAGPGPGPGPRWLRAFPAPGPPQRLPHTATGIPAPVYFSHGEDIAPRRRDRSRGLSIPPVPSRGHPGARAAPSRREAAGPAPVCGVSPPPTRANPGWGCRGAEQREWGRYRYRGGSPGAGPRGLSPYKLLAAAHRFVSLFFLIKQSESVSKI